MEQTSSRRCSRGPTRRLTTYVTAMARPIPRPAAAPSALLAERPPALPKSLDIAGGPGLAARPVLDTRESLAWMLWF